MKKELWRLTLCLLLLWKNDAIRVAKEYHRGTEMVPLLGRFKKNPTLTRQEVRVGIILPFLLPFHPWSSSRRKRLTTRASSPCGPRPPSSRPRTSLPPFCSQSSDSRSYPFFFFLSFFLEGPHSTEPLCCSFTSAPDSCGQ